MKRSNIFLLSIFLISLSGACNSSNEKNKADEFRAQQLPPIQTEAQNGLKKAYFASGCFWCVEAVYESVNGIKDAVAGYSGGTTKNPSYEKHGDHAETIEVIYDPLVISYDKLLDVYFSSQDVEQVNGQGPDRGSSYRSIVFYQNDAEKKSVENKIASINIKLGGDKVAAQVIPFQKFYIAEDYHQDYEKNNPGNPYIQNVSIPRLNKFKEKNQELLKENKKKER